MSNNQLTKQRTFFLDNNDPKNLNPFHNPKSNHQSPLKEFKRTKSIRPFFPKTNLEKIVEVLKEASTLFDSQNNKVMSLKLEWAIIEITSNDIYSYDLNEGDEGFGQCDYLKIFSPEIMETDGNNKYNNKIEVGSNNNRAENYENKNARENFVSYQKFDNFEKSERIPRKIEFGINKEYKKGTSQPRYKKDYNSNSFIDKMQTSNPHNISNLSNIVLYNTNSSVKKSKFRKHSVKIMSFTHLVDTTKKRNETKDIKLIKEGNSPMIDIANLPQDDANYIPNIKEIRNNFIDMHLAKASTPANKNKANHITNNITKFANEPSFQRNSKKFLTKQVKTKPKSITFKDFGITFDVFKYSEDAGRANLIKDISIASFAYRNCNSRLEATALEPFLEELRIGYTTEKSAFYHNDFHAADVLQGVVDMIANCNLDTILDLSIIDIISTMFSAVIHDFKHPGFNNGFMINSKNKLAIQYNGKLLT